MKKISKQNVMMTLWLTAFFATPTLYNACTGPFQAIKSGTFSSGGDGGENVPSGKLTFSEHISPLISKNCASCHSRGNALAPFPLESYEDVAQFADAVHFSIVNRTMPPPGVDNSGECQTFSDVQWMTDTEIEIVDEWFKAGMKVGDPDHKMQLPEKPASLAADKTVQMPQAYTPQPPAGEIDDYRCFVVDPQVTANTFITGMDILPDRDEIVHHIIVFKPTTVQAQNDAEGRDGSDGRPGYSCFGSAGVPASVVGLWAPGGKPMEFADPQTGEQLGLAIEANRKLIIQVHYNTQNGVFADQSSIALKFSNTAKPVRWLLVADIDLNLEPGKSFVAESVTQTISRITLVTNSYEAGSLPTPQELLNPPPSTPKKFYAVGPHMHTLGTALLLQKIGGDNSCVARVPKWDFNWQSGATYRQPVIVQANESINLSCSFSTVGRTEVVNFGEGTNDEMCLAFVLAADL